MTDKDEIYDDKSREEKVENDELSPAEDAFMKGYEKDYSEGKDEPKEDDVDKEFE